ncbi:class F sortase [Cohnella hashimotonis]|uniref:Class F sortase n=1 Tax=Cohnella hashimotonis TaxID=2826895 RepID=A0ABT6TLC3_9BACL|nr:class F sortase [Cohnella hashimotonis]MDI4647371.1 class F sortase [Cohnella hashimotonis]
MKIILKLAVVIALVAAMAGCSAAKENQESQSIDRRDHPLQELKFRPCDTTDATDATEDIDIIHKPLALQKPKRTNTIASSGIVPARIYIPAIDLHADVASVSVNDNGQMDVPKDDKTVGYLLNGVYPGAIGNAVMDGHYDNYKGAAVFFHLKRLSKGDIVVVKNKDGAAIEFAVESVRSYKTSEAPLSSIFGPSDEARLNLITCSGKYSRSKKEHQERLVVYSKRLA